METLSPLLPIVHLSNILTTIGRGRSPFSLAVTSQQQQQQQQQQQHQQQQQQHERPRTLSVIFGNECYVRKVL